MTIVGIFTKTANLSTHFMPNLMIKPRFLVRRIWNRLIFDWHVCVSCPSFNDKSTIPRSEVLFYIFVNTNWQVNVLYDSNVTPAQISKIMDAMHEGQFGTLLPKTVFNITEKGRTLLGMADGILEHTTDAEKTEMYLDK